MKPLYPENVNILPGDVYITTIEGVDIYHDGDTDSNHVQYIAVFGEEEGDTTPFYSEHPIPQSVKDFVDAHRNMMS